MIRNFLKHKSYIFAFLLTLGMCFSVLTYAANAERNLGFSGQLFDSGTPKTGTVNATFTFYDALTDGSVTGTPIAKTVTVANGYFGTEFSDADTAGVDFNQQLFIEVEINGTTLSPRTAVNASVSALKSFGTFSYTTAPTVGPSGSLYFNSTSEELYVSNGTSWQLAGLASSTTQWVANGTTLNYTAGNVGIGTTSPSEKLSVYGDATFAGRAIGIGAFGYVGDAPTAYLTMNLKNNAGTPELLTPANPGWFTRFGGSAAGNDNFTIGRIAAGGSWGTQKALFSINNMGSATFGLFQGPNGYVYQLKSFSENTSKFTNFDNFVIDNQAISTSSSLTKTGIRISSTGSWNGTSSANVGLYVSSVTGGTVNYDAIFNGGGNVGIGTTTPGAKFVVKGTGTGTGTIAQFTDSANTSRFTILDNGAIGIGTTTPEYSLDITNGAQAIRSFSNTNAAGGFIRLMHARGTSAAPIVVNSADRLSAVVSQGFDGSSFYVASTIETHVDGTVATGSIPSSMRFSTTPIGGVSRLERMRITNAGFMGIGVTDPDSKLTIIASSTTFANQFTLRSSRAALVNGDILGAIDFASNDTNLGTLGSTTASIVAIANTTHTTSALGTDLSFRVTNGATTSEALRILGNGNVGIGTGVPSYLTHIASGVTTGVNALLRLQNNNTNAGAGTSLDFVATSNTGTTTAQASIAHVRTNRAVSGDSDLYFSTFSNGALSERMRILDNGNIGIGTTTPSDKLSVIGTGSFTGAVTLSGNLLANAIVYTREVRAGSTNGNLSLMGSDRTDSAKIVLQGLSAGSDIQFLTDPTNSVSAATIQMVIKKNGNVGIGTSTPDAKLDIKSASSTLKGLVIQGAASQSANLQEWQTNGGTVVTSINSSGYLTWAGGLGYLGASGEINSYGGVYGNQARFGLGINGPAVSNIGPGYQFFNANNITSGSVSAAIRQLSPGVLEINNGTGGLSTSTQLVVGSFIATSTTANSIFMGNVGIGTTTPGVKLVVQGATLLNGVTTINGSTTISSLSGNTTVSNFSLLSSSGSGIVFDGFNNLNLYQGGVVVAENFGDSSNFAWLSKDRGTYISNQRVITNGRIGVGTANPSTPVEIAINASSPGQKWSFASAPTVYGLTLNQIEGSSNIRYSFVQRNVSIDYNVLAFEMGNVGMGTLSPTAKLDVVGNIKASGNLTLGNINVGSGNSGDNAVGNINSTFGISNTGSTFGNRVNVIGWANTVSDGGNTGISRVSIFGTENLVRNTTGNYGTVNYNAIFGLNNIISDAAGATVFGSGITNAIGGSTMIGPSDAAKVTILSSGNVGIGTTTPGVKLSVVGSIASTDLLGGLTTLSVDASGNIIRTPSDQKLKTNVETLTSALDKVNQMRGVSYTWLDTTRFGTSSEIGFIAQELESVVPEVVKSGGEYKSVNYQNLTALLTEAIKELSTKFNTLSEIVKTKFVDADKVKTKELCIGDTCITEQEFKQVLQNRNSSSRTPAPTPAPQAVEDEAPTEEPAPEPAPEAPVEAAPPAETPAE